MNDCHNPDISNHPFHGSFWVKNPHFRRQNTTGYFSTCLDYAHKEVRDYYMALIDETLERYDIDGLELDFMREPYVFSADMEKRGMPILSAWLGDVRKRVADAAVRRGHSIRLGIRVPSRPDVAFAMGLDAVSWAKNGLVDVLVATPRWSTLEFDIPISQWRQAMAGTKVTLAGGLEVLYRPVPSDAPSVVGEELARGAAGAILSQGADAVYLFNFFESNFPGAAHRRVIKPMSSLDSILKQPRAVGVTWRDITAPGEIYTPPLPANGKESAFVLRLGPAPSKKWDCVVVVGLAPGVDGQRPPVVTVNGVGCVFLKEQAIANDKPSRLLSFRVPASAIKGKEEHEVRVIRNDGEPSAIALVEMRVKPHQTP